MSAFVSSYHSGHCVTVFDWSPIFASVNHQPFSDCCPCCPDQEYRVKLEKVYLVREELKSHIQNLPDISKLPNVTGGFAPLPSAGDLFS